MRIHSLKALLLVTTGLFITSKVVAEGSLQVGLTQPLSDFSESWSTWSEDEPSSLYVDIEAASEVINISLCGDDQSDILSVTIYDSSNNEVYSSGNMSSNLDCTSDLSSALTSPIRYVAGTVDTYRLEFENLSGTIFRRYDVTVTPDINVDPDPSVANGRLWSYSWNIDTGSFGEEKSTDADFFTLVPGGRPATNYIWKLDLNNFAGYWYYLVANELGVSEPGSGYSTPMGSNSVNWKYPQYLSVPSRALVQPSQPPILHSAKFVDNENQDFAISPGISNGIQDSGVFEFESDVKGNYAVYIDLNGNGVMGDSGDQTLIGNAVIGVNQVEWDGTDANGQLVLEGRYNAEIAVRMGEYHFVTVDAETSGGGIAAADSSSSHGLTIYSVDTSGISTDVQVYWDDLTVLGLGQSNTPFGALSSSSEGKHTWGDFTYSGMGNDAFIDTYVYGLTSYVTTQLMVVNNDAVITGSDGTISVASDFDAGDAPLVTVLDDDLNILESAVESITVSVRNKRTSEWVMLVLNETSANSGVFTHNLPTIEADANGDHGDVLAVLPGDTVEFQYLDQLTTGGGSIIRKIDAYTRLDSDNDGLIDPNDPDDDNDGISDETEDAGNVFRDSDSDGIVDRLDSDSDNDGILDLLEGSADIDLDGLGNYIDTDSDGDGILDSVEGATDFDGDNVANYVDDDADNDGISDSIERDDDTDLDGNPNYLDEDSDGDGISDAVEGLNDSDGDEVSDYLDLDSDNDSIPDAQEGGGDTDSDGTPDYLDKDSDEDGIQDSLEGEQDADNDGIANYRDLDSDGDGIPDADELTRDSDGDFVANFLDPDSDGDGVSDMLEGAADFDEDGVPNYLDLDSDDDGILDITEGGLDEDGDGQLDYLDIDADNDGITDAQEGTGDSDGDGLVDSLDNDSDNDGISDLIEGLTDTDGDGIANYLDLDSDGDGITDNEEFPQGDSDADGIRNAYDIDSDNDTIPDSVEGLIDTDGDTVSDYIDLDSDNDGVSDLAESGVNASVDVNNDGRVDGDVGANGFLDSVETAVDSGLIDYNDDNIEDVNVDTDSDGIADFRDLDSDNDGLSDLIESGFSDNDNNALLDDFTDTNGDGVNDLTNFAPAADVDHDGLPNRIDSDSDGDGLYDVVEADGSDVDNDGIVDGFDDSDGDGRDDNAALVDVDTDADGVADRLDTDSDNDSITDFEEGAVDTDADGISDYRDVDSDNDGIDDRSETTADFDEDGVANYRDTDSDGDGNSDADEGALDSDSDGVSDAYDLDSDNDGIPDREEGSADTDGDGLADFVDLDSDNDGVSDLVESGSNTARDTDGNDQADGPYGGNGLADNLETGIDSGQTDHNGDGTIDHAVDTDGDSVPDYLDLDSDNDGLTDAVESAVNDSDNDGVTDRLDLDSDNDGIDDLVEAGGTDTNNDGTLDNFTDTNANGLADAIENQALPDDDTDGDGEKDRVDSDSDGDGLSDKLEGVEDTDGDHVANYLDLDSDGDGVNDFTEANLDSDKDGLPDHLDNDADNDGIPDLNESHADTDGDGMADYLDTDSDGDGINDIDESTQDSDGDGIANYLDLDSDGDGIPDQLEGGGDADHDGVNNYLDLDSDNDGIYDLTESRAQNATNQKLDSDNDGIIDSSYSIGMNGWADVLETAPDSAISDYTPIDTDSDSVKDFLDLDSDNDSITDVIESAHSDTDFNGRIDGFVDEFGVIAGTQTQTLDSDHDGVANFRDLDSDNDGLSDLVEARRSDLNGDAVIDNFIDTNHDGLSDAVLSRLASVPDTDHDGIEDYRDLDSDQDGLSDLLESQGEDRGQDGLLDDFSDTDGNGLDDGVQAIAVTEQDSDGDLIPDQLDLDSDNDGQSDQSEVGGVDLDNNGILDALNDSDFDGIPDLVDVDQTGGQDRDNDSIDDSADADFVNSNDTDGDGIVDEFDSDADGNGLQDDGSGMPITGTALPDSDNNGVPDYQQALNGKVSTAMGGCSMSKSNTVIDPLLPLLLLGAVFGLQRRCTKKASKASAAALVAAVVLTTPFMANDTYASDFNRRVYIGANVGMSQLDPDASDIDSTVDEKNDLGFGLNLGMDISNRVSAEIHANVLGTATLAPTGEIDYKVYGLSALIYGLNSAESRDLRENFSGYIRLGLDTMKNSADVPYELENDLSWVLGLGAEYGLSNGLAMRGELTRFYSDAYYAGLGVVYRFGGQQQENAGRAYSEVVAASVPMEPEEPSIEEPSPLITDAEPVAIAIDQDNDGIVDNVDQCLGSNPKLPVDAVGCALFDGVMEGVTFESASATLTARAQQVLDKAAKDLLNYPSVRVAVMAHTDNQGDAELNLELSKKRVISVVRYLLGQGVPMKRMRAEAYGEKRPIASNETVDGRERNRRVEFQTIE